MKGYVYLLHFREPVGTAKPENGTLPDSMHTQAQHYIGWCSNVEACYRDHLAGNGASLTAFAAEHGIEMVIARTWEFNTHRAAWTHENRLKNVYKAAPRLCPICSGDVAYQRGNPK
jgi:predicted GIY-YIG superfamily endonuclease